MGTEHPHARGGFIQDGAEERVYARFKLVDSDPEVIGKLFEGHSESYDLSFSNLPANHVDDMVHSPSHYTAYKGLEIIDLTEQMNFNRGNVVKYVSRAGLKDPSKEIEDLEKAEFYLRREIDRLRETV